MPLNILNTKLLNQTWGLNLRDMFISGEAAKINKAKKKKKSVYFCDLYCSEAISSVLIFIQ